MTMTLSRRRLLWSGLALGTMGIAPVVQANALYGGDDEQYFNPELLPPAESEVVTQRDVGA